MMLLTFFWSFSGLRLQTSWFERVSSAANILDSVSRGDLSFAYSFGAQQVSVNIDTVWTLLSQAARDNEFATAEVGSQIRTLVCRNGQGL